QGELAIRGQEDKGTRNSNLLVSPSPCLLVPLSPTLPVSSSLLTIVPMPRLFAAEQVCEAASRVEKASDYDLYGATVDGLFKALDQITIDQLPSDHPPRAHDRRDDYINIGQRVFGFAIRTDADVADPGFTEQAEFKLGAISEAPAEGFQTAPPIAFLQADF